jgi:sulfur-oxidizing protein SoxX
MVVTVCAAQFAPECVRAAESASRSPEAAIGWTAPDAIGEPLGGRAGDPARGRAIVVDRSLGMCLVCHTGPFPEVRQQGGLATDLSGAGSRWRPAQLRARIVDARRIDPTSIMPAFHRTDGLSRVAPAWRNRPMLDAQQVEDVVAFLTGLHHADGATGR